MGRSSTAKKSEPRDAATKLAQQRICLLAAVLENEVLKCIKIIKIDKRFQPTK